MRISDWSSDVCSSDLIEWQEPSQRQLRAAIQHVALELGDNERQPRDLGGEWAQFNTTKIGEGDVALDRKRVVEGKSVSVRVDLGGRRIIKKKKQTIRQYCSKTHITNKNEVVHI